VDQSDDSSRAPHPVFEGLEPLAPSERRSARQSKGIAVAAGAIPLIAATALSWITAPSFPSEEDAQTQSPPTPTPEESDGTDVVSLTGETSHTVVEGDSLQSIAEQHGIPTAALLALNGLSWQTEIHPGQELVVSKGQQATVDAEAVLPAAVESPQLASGTRAKPGGGVADGEMITRLTDEMATNARIIIQVGREMKIPNYGIVIALATAAQESTLRNLNYGDRDSVGLFQQRPSSGWGTPQQILDPRYATRAFFGGPNSPTPGNTRGLLDIPGWQNKSVAAAAQAVQISAFPDAYAKWETSAWNWLFELT
jgi:LysM repeat protein